MPPSAEGVRAFASALSLDCPAVGAPASVGFWLSRGVSPIELRCPAVPPCSGGTLSRRGAGAVKLCTQPMSRRLRDAKLCCNLSNRQPSLEQRSRFCFDAVPVFLSVATGDASLEKGRYWLRGQVPGHDDLRFCLGGTKTSRANLLEDVHRWRGPGLPPGYPPNLQTAVSHYRRLATALSRRHTTISDAVAHQRHRHLNRDTVFCHLGHKVMPEVMRAQASQAGCLGETPPSGAPARLRSSRIKSGSTQFRVAGFGVFRQVGW